MQLKQRTTELLPGNIEGVSAFSFRSGSFCHTDASHVTKTQNTKNETNAANHTTTTPVCVTCFDVVVHNRCSSFL